MKIYNKLLNVTVALMLSFTSLSAHAIDPDNLEIILGKGVGPSSDVFIGGIKPILEKQGYKVTIKSLSELFTPDVALYEGEVDINVEQHSAYIDFFNKNQNADLIGITHIPTILAAIYPGKKNDLKDVADGDRFAIPNDAPKTERCLAILHKAALLKFDPNKDFISITVNDIIENPKNLKFTELSAGTIPTVASDFDFIIISGPRAYDAKMDPNTALIREDLRPYLILQTVVKKTNKDKIWVKDIIKA